MQYACPCSLTFVYQTYARDILFTFGVSGFIRKFSQSDVRAPGVNIRGGARSGPGALEFVVPAPAPRAAAGRALAHTQLTSDLSRGMFLIWHAVVGLVGLVYRRPHRNREPTSASGASSFVFNLRTQKAQ